MGHKKSMGSLHLCGIGDYEPGDLPPEGYLAWHNWAEVQFKAGIMQTPCKICKKWKTPQECLDGEIDICLECAK